MSPPSISSERKGGKVGKKRGLLYLPYQKKGRKHGGVFNFKGLEKGKKKKKKTRSIHPIFRNKKVISRKKGGGEMAEGKTSFLSPPCLKKSKNIPEKKKRGGSLTISLYEEGRELERGEQMVTSQPFQKERIEGVILLGKKRGKMTSITLLTTGQRRVELFSFIPREFSSTFLKKGSGSLTPPLEKS